jgi:hypothetical protein
LSEFEDKIAGRKRALQKKRQQFLQDQISEHKMAPFTFGEAFWLFQFFATEDPTDEQLAHATTLIAGTIADRKAFLQNIKDTLRGDSSE